MHYVCIHSQVALDVPDMALALSDSEYEGLVNALSYNFAELPSGPSQHPQLRILRHTVLQQQQQQQQQRQMATHSQPQQGASQEGELQKGAGVRNDAGPAGTTSTAHVSGPESDFSLDTRELLAALGDACTVVVSVRVRRASLHLLTHMHKAAGSDVPAQVCLCVQ